MSDEDIKKFTKILNKDVIKFSSCDFGFLENKEASPSSPVNGYFLALEDVSINLHISLKWALFAMFFFKSISINLNKIAESHLSLKNFLTKETSLNFNYPRLEHEIFLDDERLVDIDDFIEKLNNEYSEIFYNENSKINFKMNLNLDDFLILQNVYFPVLFL